MSIKQYLIIFALVPLLYILSGLNKIVLAQTETTQSHLGYQSKFVSLNGMRFHYVQKGEGEVMLFLHGYPFFGESWDKLLKAFALTHHVIAPDNRGYNLSAKPKGVEHYKISALVQDVRALIEHLPNTNKVILIGHDWGGALAWSVAQKYPNLISKLIVINAPPYNVLLNMIKHNPEQQKSASYMQSLKSPAVEKKFDELGPDLLWQYGFNRMQERGFLDDAFKSAFFEAWRQPGAITGALNWYRANIPRLDDINDDIYWPSKEARVTVPSLLIWGEHERIFVPAMLEEIPKYVDDIKIEVIEGANHTPFFDNTDKVIAVMQEFIKG